MVPRSLVLALAASTLLLGACDEAKVAVYRVPKEKDPEPPMAAADTGSPPPGAPGSSMADTAVPTAAGEPLVWRAPPEWSAKPATAMRKGSFSVPGPAGDCDLSITAFPGDVGGELANVNRWRGQIGLAPLAQGELEQSVSRLQSNGLGVTVVELAPAGNPDGKSMLGAIVPFGGSTWFFKLTGPGASVRASKPAFLDFVRSVRAP